MNYMERSQAVNLSYSCYGGTCSTSNFARSREGFLASVNRWSVDQKTGIQQWHWEPSIVKMRQCAVKDCTNNSSVINISFYCFPKCERRQIWIKFVGRGDGWTPKPGTTICSAHFSPHLITRRKQLRKGANPSAKLFNISTILAGTVQYIKSSFSKKLDQNCHLSL